MFTRRSEGWFERLGYPHRSNRLTALVAFALFTPLLFSGCGSAKPIEDSGANGAQSNVIRVPADAGTISEAVDRAEPGDLVLVDAGVHAEQVLVDTPDITVRGVDRNETVIDAEGVRPYGIVATADGVSVENLTVRGATFYGVLVTGLHSEDGEPSARGADGYTTIDPAKFPPVQRFRIDHVTAHNNGLYGLYAFNAQHGVITDSYASGSADSGIYVGQCEECDIHVSGNVAEHNAIGFENANASDSVTVTANRFTGNRIGATFISSYQEAFIPQRTNTVVGNLIAANDSAESPAQAEGGFGIGIGISGGQDNLLERNTIANHPRAGVLVTNVEDIAASGNLFLANLFTTNAIDVANTSSSRTPASNNCFEQEGEPANTSGNDAAFTTLPADLLTSCSAEQPSADPASLPRVSPPAGMSFLQVVSPVAQPNMADVEALPSRLPDRIAVPDLASLSAPSIDYLSDRTTAP